MLMSLTFIIIIILISSPDLRAQHCNYATLLAGMTFMILMENSNIIDILQYSGLSFTYEVILIE